MKKGRLKGQRFRRSWRTSTCITSSTSGRISGDAGTRRGEVIIVRYADDFIVGFERRSDAARFLRDLRERLRKFSLELHAEKTRLIEFGRYAAERSQRAESRKAGDLQLPRFHAHLREDEVGEFLAHPAHGSATDASEAAGGQTGAPAALASARPRAGPVAGQRGAWLHRLLCRADERAGTASVSHPGGAATGFMRFGVEASGTASTGRACE